MGIACDDNARIIVADRKAATVHVYNENGVYERELDARQGLSAGETSNPWGVVYKGNMCYVTDGEAFVWIFNSSNGAYKAKWLSTPP